MFRRPFSVDTREVIADEDCECHLCGAPLLSGTGVREVGGVPTCPRHYGYKVGPRVTQERDRQRAYYGNFRVGLRGPRGVPGGEGEGEGEGMSVEFSFDPRMLLATLPLKH
ncbi:hypothetical protein KIPB_007168, partial [Kipferlia bialata]|eukprot:g7168.t1